MESPCSSEYNLSLVVKDADTNEGIRAIHQAFELEKI